MPVDLPEHRIGRLASILIGFLVVFAGGAVCLSPGRLILILNGLALTVAAGVSTAYLPIAGAALARRSPSRGDVLGIGIFLAGAASVALRLVSIVARDLGRPGLLNSPLAAFSIFLGLGALVAFLWAPYAEDSTIPRERWTRAGLIVAAGVAVAFAAGFTHQAFAPSPLVRLE